MREVVRFLHVLGIRVLNYIDDLLWAGRKEQIAELVQFARWLLGLLEWECSNKTRWDPTQLLLFLGFLVDAAAYVFRLPEEKAATRAGAS